jgi:DNA topoisomerase-2
LGERAKGGSGGHPRNVLAVQWSEKKGDATFVNNISTSSGGTHLKTVTELLCEAIMSMIRKRKNVSSNAKQLTAKDIERHLFVFFSCMVINPAFDSQSKFKLTTKSKDVGAVILTDAEKRELVSKAVEARAAVATKLAEAPASMSKPDKTKLRHELEKAATQAEADAQLSVMSRPMVLPKHFLEKLEASGIVDQFIAKADEMQNRVLQATDAKKNSAKHKRRLLGIPKLEDANWADTKDAHQCTLILTEGDSAKAMVTSALAILGRDRYGVFPLKGKLLNVRDAKVQTLVANDEINHLKQILGLQSGRVYTSVQGLRYGRVMLLTDQDHDGSHIKGLVINLLMHCWPSLLQLRNPSFLWEFNTPIVKMSKGYSASGMPTSAQAQEIFFLSLVEWEAWKRSHADGKGWTTKYYKGLGTSTALEAKCYFADLDRHLVEFVWDPQAADRVRLAFSAKAANERKDWLAAFDPKNHRVAGQRQVCYSDFVDKELIVFSMADNQRSIPSLVDGLKPSQRKILFGMFKRSQTREIKVAQLAGYVSKLTAYHHGETSLSGTTINMAQNFVGSGNNINLLLPNGQFGTRLQGGKDAASERYIFTALSPVARPLFPEADDALLTFCRDDGIQIEPEWYVPIVPMVLINGAEGIGTGWRTFVPRFQPIATADAVRAWIEWFEWKERGDMEKQEQLRASWLHQVGGMRPWEKGFRGTVVPNGPQRYTSKGVVERVDGTRLHITELPIGTWTSEYKGQQLENMLADKIIEDFQEFHTDTTVSFLVTVTPERMSEFDADPALVYKTFKLDSFLSTANMVLFDEHGKLVKYQSIADIMDAFCAVRMRFYVKRKAVVLAALQYEMEKLANRVRLLQTLCGLNKEPPLHIWNKPRQTIEAELTARHYRKMTSKSVQPSASSHDDAMSDDENEDTGESKSQDNVGAAAAASAAGAAKTSGARPPSYDYLLNMDLGSVSKERIVSLEKELADARRKHDEMLRSTPGTMWRADLDAFEVALSKQEADERTMEELANKKAISIAARNKRAYVPPAKAPRGVVIVDPTVYSAEAVPKSAKGTKRKRDGDADTAEAEPAAVLEPETESMADAPPSASAAAATVPHAAAKPKAASKSSGHRRNNEIPMVVLDEEEDDDYGLVAQASYFAPIAAAAATSAAAAAAASRGPSSFFPA